MGRITWWKLDMKGRADYITNPVLAAATPSVSLRLFSTWLTEDVWFSGVWGLWPLTCTTWRRSTHGPTACQSWSSSWAAIAERYRTGYEQYLRQNAVLSKHLNHFWFSRQEGSWRWLLWGSWLVWSGTCMGNITSGKASFIHAWGQTSELHMCPVLHYVVSSLVRLLLLLYLLYIGTFTLCCVFRPLKDAPENYTVSDKDKTIRIQKPLNVR